MLLLYIHATTLKTHISFMRISEVSIYDENICDKRWTNAYDWSKQNLLKDDESENNVIENVFSVDILAHTHRKT